MDSIKIKCKGCGEIKDFNEFYFVYSKCEINDIANMQCELCKDCIEDFNRHSTNGDKNNYLHWQFIACYFIAKQVFDDNKKSIKQIVQNVENGYKKYGDNINDKNAKKTFTDGVCNLLYLFYERSFSHANNKQRKVFEALNSTKNSTQIVNAVKEILAEDYETFKKFKQGRIKCKN